MAGTTHQLTGGALGVVGQLLVVLGVALVAVGALGLLRLPDAYLRANAVTKAAALGLVLVLLGTAVLAPGLDAVLVLLVAAALQLFTVPVAGYAVGSAAWRARAPMDPRTQREEGTGPAVDPDGPDGPVGEAPDLRS
ncbi:monovalent cation/H(+) antiporter subunit G [Quadrisphaera sp. INWT6]|uniref:monovalent cation/H(+) antiporter subunit G n=1 Tax=Quadrisphaera sp. INWT6 TaxID=2596917 RepID=UPI00189260BF|nr:monovalent cation/H(+) antiporter subunit G [Quadrisphaera sp. INWT6]MBF5083226.1 cation:proton antiporter [Quadrisphaera sp. INWT6]